jgi:O-acetyl-ADP-ribose deacetylase (regulator of RNase III)
MCKAVIHTVGPKMGEGNEDYKLEKQLEAVFYYIRKRL